MWKRNVETLSKDVAREKRVPMEEIELHVKEIVERNSNNEQLQHELVRQEKELSTQQETAMELMTIQGKYFKSEGERASRIWKAL